MQATFNTVLPALAAQLQMRGWYLSCAESCTGGLVAAACTDLAGSSQWFELGFVTYSDRAKTECLGVSTALLQMCGAVSQPVVLAMAQGAATAAQTQVALATSGIAGPGGATPAKPAGMVCFGFYINGACSSQTRYFQGTRQAVRTQSVEYALQTLQALLCDQPFTRKG